MLDDLNNMILSYSFVKIIRFSLFPSIKRTNPTSHAILHPIESERTEISKKVLFHFRLSLLWNNLLSLLNVQSQKILQ